MAFKMKNFSAFKKSRKKIKISEAARSASQIPGIIGQAVIKSVIPPYFNFGRKVKLHKAKEPVDVRGIQGEGESRAK